MSNVEYEKLVEQVLKASGALGSAKKDLRQELENHIWEAIRVLEGEGVSSDNIPTIIIQRFGSPREIGKQFATMYNTIYVVGKIILTFTIGLVALFILLPLEGPDAFYKYHDAIEERYIDVGWYDRTVALHSGLDASECTYPVDGVENVGLPAGNILTLCHTKWLVMKFLPPLQISGTRIDRADVLRVMKMEGGLRSVDAAYGEDDLEEIAELVLEDYLRALAIGAWHAPTDDIIAMNFDEPIEMGEAVDREYALLEAATYWEGDLSQLVEWNPDINPTDEVELLRAACEKQLLCYTLRQAMVQSVSRGDDQAVVVFDVQLHGESDVVNASHFEFQVTRFEHGYPNDTTDDIFRVTKGFAYLP